MTDEQDVIGYAPIRRVVPGRIATAACIVCSKCGALISGMGGPGPRDALCMSCLVPVAHIRDLEARLAAAERSRWGQASACHGRAKCDQTYCAMRDLMLAEKARAEAAEKERDRLRHLINVDYAGECKPTCDSFGHAEDCAASSFYAQWEDALRRAEAAEALLRTIDERGMSAPIEEALRDYLAAAGKESRCKPAA